MNKLLVAIFDSQTAAERGLQALGNLHAKGDITLYTAGVIAKDGEGNIDIVKAPEASVSGTATGLAIGGLMGLLGGPMGLAAGAVTGTLVGAVRDFWVAGVGLDFIEEAGSRLLPSKAALVAEVEEEWVIPVDVALEALGAQVSRRARSDIAEAQLEHDIASLKAEIQALETEASQAGTAARTHLYARLTAANASLDRALQRAHQRALALRKEADTKAEALQTQLSEVRSEVKLKVEARVKRVKNAYHLRGAKLSHAWSSTRDALTFGSKQLEHSAP